MSIARTNLNPGSLKVNNSNINLQGLIDPIIGNFAKFNTTTNGFRGLTRDLLVKESRGLTSINKIISVYAPEVGDNNTQAYISDVASRVGILKDQTLDFKNNPRRLRSMVEAVAFHEDNGISYDPNIIDTGIVSEGTFNLSQIQISKPSIDTNNIKIAGTSLSSQSVTDAKSSTSADNLTGINDESAGGEFPKKRKDKLTANSQKIIDKSKPNPLNEFAEYTYNITWAVLTKEIYNRIVDLELNSSQSSNFNSIFSSIENSGGIILKSGGSNIKIKSEFFQEDFYINNLNINSLVGMRMDTRATNVTNITFEVYEPYGVTLMERIYSLSQVIEDGNKNYLTQPYALIINFFGFGDDGKTLKLPFTRRLIPMKLTDITLSVNAGGATYNVVAIPFNESANTLRYGKFDSDQTLVATTIGEALETGSIVTKREKLTQIDVDGQEIGRSSNLEDSKTFTIDNDQIKGIAGVLNAEQTFKTKRGYQEFPDIYRIIIDKKFNPKFKDAKIIKNQTTENKARNTSFATGKTEGKKLSPIINNNSKIPKTKKITINAGKNIFDMINSIIIKSDYLTSQFSQQGKDGEKKIKKPLKFYKITTHVKLGQFDRCRNDFARDITFFVKPYRIGAANYTFADVKDEIIIVKQYDYIFTGKNTQVLNFDINFNLSYFESRNVATETKIGHEGRDNQQTTQTTKSLNLKSDDLRICVDPKTRIPVSNHPTIWSNTPGVQDSDNADQYQSRSLFEALMKTTRGDLVNLDLQIIGDPDYIFQQSYFSPVTPQTKIVFDPLTKSIQTDDREIFIRIKIRTPTDLNEKTGIVNFNKSIKTKFRGNKESAISSMFSGIYKVVDATNIFNSGQFTQTLRGYRVFDQVEDKVGTSEQTSTTIRQIANVEDAGLPRNLGDSDGIIQPKTQKSVVNIDNRDSARNQESVINDDNRNPIKIQGSVINIDNRNINVPNKNPGLGIGANPIDTPTGS